MEPKLTTMSQNDQKLKWEFASKEKCKKQNFFTESLSFIYTTRIYVKLGGSEGKIFFRVP